VHCIKTAEHIIEILSRSDRPIIIFFVTKGRCVNLRASLPTGAPYKGVAVFDQYAAISRKRSVIDRGIVMEDENKVACALSNSAAFDDLE